MIQLGIRVELCDCVARTAESRKFRNATKLPACHMLARRRPGTLLNALAAPLTESEKDSRAFTLSSAECMFRLGLSSAVWHSFTCSARGSRFKARSFRGPASGYRRIIPCGCNARAAIACYMFVCRMNSHGWQRCRRFRLWKKLKNSNRASLSLSVDVSADTIVTPAALKLQGALISVHDFLMHAIPLLAVFRRNN